MNIVLLGTHPSLQCDRLDGLLAGRHNVVPSLDGADPAERARLLADADVLVSARFDKSLPPMPRLRLLQSPSAGIENISIADVPADVIVCAGLGHELGMAEYALCAMLDWTIGYRSLASTFVDGRWNIGMWIRGPVHRELAGRVVGLIGYGAVAREVAVRAQAFGMEVRAISRWSNGTPTDGLQVRTYHWRDRKAFLAGADFLIVTLPLAEDTKSIIDAAWFAEMSEKAVLINVSRGGVVDEDAMFEALAANRIGGAVLDVWYAYPKDDGALVAPGRRSFHELKNVVMTPHASGRTHGAFERRWQIMARNIANLEAGGPFAGQVARK